MTVFLRLLADKDKAIALQVVSSAVRDGLADSRLFEVRPDSFDAVPGKPFAYWVSEAVRKLFQILPPFESEMRSVRQGLATADDFRFVRAWWENNDGDRWSPFAKGGAYSPYYSDLNLVLNWHPEGKEIKAWADPLYGNSGWSRIIKSSDYYFRPGAFQTLRAARLAPHLTPAGACFGHNGFQAFDANENLLSTLALLNSSSLETLYKMQLGRHGFALYIAGTLQQTPIPPLNADQKMQLSSLARRAWSLTRTLDTIEETSHAFALPATLRARLGEYDPPAIETEMARIQTEIDVFAYDLYGFSEADRAAVQASQGSANEGDAEANANYEGDDEDSVTPIDQTAGLSSWAVGVAFGRFDWRLAIDERATPPEPDPFDPLPTKSPGMLPDGAEPFHAHAGILLDDPGHPHDLAHLIEEVLARVNVTVPDDVCRWLQRDFFASHLQRYSKSRRKAPIYWPLATSSGSYTLWLYYPSLNSQTLYTAINDFVEPKLKQVGDDLAALRNKGTARTREDEKRFETLHAFELELIELRDTLLNIAPHYHPNHDDGVQITAAPLWPLFRYKPWQKVLKDTWAKLEKGDYDWAHLAMNYWPARVREKCKTDKSLAIAHGLEELYVEPEAKPKKTRGKKKADE
jgi:hypothetical protein